MRFQDPIVGGSTLIRPAIQSPDYVAGVSGWAIKRDGPAEFYSVTMRGSWIVTDGTNTLTGAVSTVPSSPIGSATPLPNISLDLASPYTPGYLYAFGQGAGQTSAVIIASPDDTSVSLSNMSFMVAQDAAAGYGYTYANGYGLQQLSFDWGADITTTSSNSSTVTPGNAVTVVSVTVDVPTSSTFLPRIQVMAGWHGVDVTGPSATIGNNRATIRIEEDGSQIRGARLILQNTTQSQSGGTIAYIGPRLIANPGSHTYSLVLYHEATSSATSMNIAANSSSPAWISVKGF